MPMVLVKMIQLKVNTNRYSQIDKKETVINNVTYYAAYINNNGFFISLSIFNHNVFFYSHNKYHLIYDKPFK